MYRLGRPGTRILAVTVTFKFPSSSESYESLPEYADFTFFRRGMIEMRCTSRLQRAMPLDGEQQR